MIASIFCSHNCCWYVNNLFTSTLTPITSPSPIDVIELKGERTLIIILQADGHSTPHYVVSVPPFSSSAHDLRALTFLTWQIRSPIAAVKHWGLCLTFSGAVMSWRAVPIKALQGVKRSDRQGNADHNASFSSRPWKQGKMTQEFWSYSLAKQLSSHPILPILPACRKQPFPEMFPMQEL